MDRHINCIVHSSSEGRLLVGDDHAAIVDCGMAFCAAETIKKVKNALNGRNLDYILLTHTHYDHVGALPYFRKEWPQIRIIAGDIGAAALLKATPRRVIREFSIIAAKQFGRGEDISFDDDAFYADIIVKDGDAIQLGGISAQVLEMPGHTRDSLSYYIPEIELLMLNETPGVLMSDGSICPCFLTSYRDTIKSMVKCRRIKFKELSLPHRGIIGADTIDDFFEKALETDKECHELTVDMLNKGLSDDAIFQALCNQYMSEAILSYQPKEAFEVNIKAIIASSKREMTSG